MPDAHFDWNVLVANKNKEIARLEGLYRQNVDRAGVEVYMERAEFLDPAALAFERGRIWREAGEHSIASLFLERALELDPVSVTANWEAAYVFLLARQYDQAIEQGRKTLELDPNFLPAHNQLGNAYIYSSMYKEGIAEFEKELAISPGDNLALAGLGYAYALTGRRVEAQKMLDQMNEIAKQKYVPAVYRARTYVALGDQEKAFEWLETGYQERSVLGQFRVDPAYDSLRSDPRFADLLRRMNLQP